MSFFSQQLKFNTKTITYTGAANLGQAGTNTTIFTVTGTILVVALVPVCTVNLDQALATATITLGTAGTTNLFIAATNSVDIDADDLWTAAAPATKSLALPAALKDIVVSGENIVNACATQNTNAGAIRYDIYWLPLSSDAAVA